MLTRIRSRLTYANVVGTLALVLAVTGAGFAAAGTPSIGGAPVQANAKAKGFTGVLPSGKTLRGVYQAGGTYVNGSTIQTSRYSAVSFPLALSKAPKAHFIEKATAPPKACPGNVNSPQAKPGHLCVYEGGQWSEGEKGFLDPRTQATAGASRWGFLVTVARGQTGFTYGFETHGVWAVTAP